MRLTDKHYQIIERLMAGDTISAIARDNKMSRQTIYDWMENEDFAAEMDKQRQDRKNQWQRKFEARMDDAMARMWELSQCSDVRTARQATSEWMAYATNKVGQNIILQSNENGNKDYDIESALLRLSDYKEPEKKCRNPLKMWAESIQVNKTTKS